MDNRIIRMCFSAITVAVLSSACTANYWNINRNQCGVTDSEMQRDGYAVKAALIGIANGVISPDVNTTQYTECLLGGTMGGYMADSNPGLSETISNYNPKDEWTNVFMKSSWIIPTIYANYRLLHQVTDDPVMWAVGDIIKVAAMHRVTDTYGPVPYSKIGQNGEINVAYDSQLEVYTKMFEELDAAIETLMPERMNNFSASADVIYGGVVDKWIKFANSLKLRLAMRVSYCAPELSEAMAESAVMHEVGVMTSNDDNAVFSSWGTDGNPINRAVEYNKVRTHDDGSACITQGGDSHAAADIICYMNGYNDPRRAVYFTQSEWTGYQYVGMRRGIEIPSLSSVGHKYSGVNVDVDDAAFWMTAAEVAFLEAEAVAVFGYDLGIDAQAAYEKGISLSFEQWGVSGAAEYIANSSLVPTAYNDPAGANSYASPSSITIAWNQSADKEEMQERIITQKWIANWLLGNEAWADWRRTGYPRLFPCTDAGNKSGGKVDNVTGARRMKYPYDENVSNTVNYQAAVQMLGGDGDEMRTRLQFDCKENNPSYSR